MWAVETSTSQQDSGWKTNKEKGNSDVGKLFPPHPKWHLLVIRFQFLFWNLTISRTAQNLFLLTFPSTEQHLRHALMEHLCRNRKSDFLNISLSGDPMHPNRPWHYLRTFPREPGPLVVETEGFLVLG